MMINYIDPIFIEIGPLTIMWYAVMILTGIVVAFIAGLFEGDKIGLDKDLIYDTVLFTVPLAIVGARLYYVLFNLDYYLSRPSQIFNIPSGGLAIHGGIIVAFFFVLWYGKRRKANFFKMFDIMAPGLLIGQIFGRWGNFFNQEAHGPITSYEFLKNTLRLPNFIVEQMKIDNVNYYHPTFLYEGVWNFVGLIIMLVLRRTKLIKHGELAGFYLMWYGLGRGLIIEPIRTDPLMFLNMRVNVVLSLLMIPLGALIIYFMRKRFKDNPYYHETLTQIKELKASEKNPTV